MRSENIYQIYENLIFFKKRGFDDLNQLLLKRSQISVLMVIYSKHVNNEMVNLKQISNILGLNNSTISPILFELEELGFIDRIIDSSDRRISFFSLTKYGLSQIDYIKNNLLSSIDSMMKILTDSEVEELLYLTNKIRVGGITE